MKFSELLIQVKTYRGRFGKGIGNCFSKLFPCHSTAMKNLFQQVEVLNANYSTETEITEKDNAAIISLLKKIIEDKKVTVADSIFAKQLEVRLFVDNMVRGKSNNPVEASRSTLSLEATEILFEDLRDTSDYAYEVIAYLLKSDKRKRAHFLPATIDDMLAATSLLVDQLHAITPRLCQALPKSSTDITLSLRAYRELFLELKSLAVHGLLNFNTYQLIRSSECSSIFTPQAILFVNECSLNTPEVYRLIQIYSRTFKNSPESVLAFKKLVLDLLEKKLDDPDIIDFVANNLLHAESLVKGLEKLKKAKLLSTECMALLAHRENPEAIADVIVILAELDRTCSIFHELKNSLHNDLLLPTLQSWKKEKFADNMVLWLMVAHPKFMPDIILLLARKKLLGEKEMRLLANLDFAAYPIILKKINDNYDSLTRENLRTILISGNQKIKTFATQNIFTAAQYGNQPQSHPRLVRSFSI